MAKRAKRAKVAKPVRCWGPVLPSGKLHIQPQWLNMEKYPGANHKTLWGEPLTFCPVIIADARHYRVVRKGAKRGK